MLIENVRFTYTGGDAQELGVTVVSMASSSAITLQKIAGLDLGFFPPIPDGFFCWREYVIGWSSLMKGLVSLSKALLNHY